MWLLAENRLDIAIVKPFWATSEDATPATEKLRSKRCYFARSDGADPGGSLESTRRVHATALNRR